MKRGVVSARNKAHLQDCWFTAANADVGIARRAIGGANVAANEVVPCSARWVAQCGNIYQAVRAATGFPYGVAAEDVFTAGACEAKVNVS